MKKCWSVGSGEGLKPQKQGKKIKTLESKGKPDNNMNQKLRPTAKRTRHRIYPALVDMTTLVRLTVPFFSMRAMSN